MSTPNHSLLSRSSSRASQETIFPKGKKDQQGDQWMNRLLRPLLGPIIPKMAAIGIKADGLTAFGILAYLGGAGLLIWGTPQTRLWGLILFLIGLFAELADGSLARWHGPSPLGYFLSQLQEELYCMLLLPSLAIGLFLERADSFGQALLILGVFGGFAEVWVRGTIAKITLAHSAESLIQQADATDNTMKLFFLAQLLPDHPKFNRKQRAARILRENLFYSTGIQPILLCLCVLGGWSSVFVLFYGVLHLLAFMAVIAAKTLLMLRGGGRIL